MRRWLLVTSTAILLGGCVRADAKPAANPEGANPATQLRAARDCSTPTGFDTLVRSARIEALAPATESSSAWLPAWRGRVLAALDEARAAHDGVWQRACESTGDDTVAWAAAQACLSRATLRLDLQLEVVGATVESRPERLAAAPEWPWALSESFSVCESTAYQQITPPLAGAENESQARAALTAIERAWTWAQLGEYAKAQALAVEAESAVRAGADAPSVFSWHLLMGYLALASGELTQAEAQLAPANALAQKLGPAAAVDLGFFRGTVATLAGDDERAARVFGRVEGLARELESAGPRYARARAEARLRRAQADWRAGDGGASATASEAYAHADGVLEADDPRRLDYLDALEQMGVEVAGAAGTRAAVRESLGADWPG